ncbi:MAG: signal transduction histidine kinase, partial [Candidatus Azotimanducaceae bacterium]
LQANTRDLIWWFCINLSSIAFAKFFAEFLLLKERWPSLNTGINLFIAIWVVLLPLEFYIQTNLLVILLTVVNTSFFLFQLCALVPMALAKQRDALFYAGGYSATLLIFAFMGMQGMGLYNDATLLNQIVSYGPQFGQFVWMMVMTYALGERFRKTSEKQEEATRESQAKSSFLATMSHEIRTPMNGVLGMTELLNNTRMDTQQKNYVSAIYSSAAALLTILDDILDYSKIQSGKLELERIPIDLNRFTSDTVLVFAAMSQQKKIPLLVNIDNTLPVAVWGDPTRIRQIVVNLLGNAFKFTSDGQIALNFYRENSNLVIAIRDTGIGISEHDQQHIFSTFSQADKSTNRKFGGSGLGLSICRDLCNIMSGSITVNSEAGIGSEFIVRLPMGDSDDEILLDIVPEKIRQLHALIYEPIDAKRQSLAKTMEDWGIQVFNAANIDEAKAVIHKQPELDVILTTTPVATRDLSTDQNFLVIQLARTSKSHQQASDGVDYVLEEPICPGALLTCLEELFCSVSATDVIEEEPMYGPRPSDLRVLVAEDNEINQKVICGMLNRLGIQPTLANNGDEAYRYYLQQQTNRNPFDLILMDCEMPQVDGYDATRLIRAYESEGDSHVEIVALTANVLPEHRKKAHDIGMDQFLTKPIRLADLQQLFSNL